MKLFRTRDTPQERSLVTVLLTTYNHEHFVEQALESVVDQATAFPYEVVVIEDCSEDRTREIVRAFASRHSDKVRLALTPSNENSNRLFASVWARCGSEYVALLDGDDYWTDRNKLQRQVDALETRPGCSFCFHDAFVVADGSPDARDTPRFVNLDPEDVTRDALWSRCFVPGCSPLLRRTLCPELPSWWVTGRDAGGASHADWALFLLYAQLGDIAYIDEPLGVYRTHRGGLWSSRRPNQQRQDIVDVLQALLDVFPQHGPVIRASLAHHRSQIERGRVRALRKTALAAAAREHDRLDALVEPIARHVPNDVAVIVLDDAVPSPPLGTRTLSLSAAPDKWELFGRGPAATRVAPWIAPGYAYEFRLLARGDASAVVARVTVVADDCVSIPAPASPPGGRFLTASPNPAPVVGTHGVTHIAWSTGDSASGDVVVAAYPLEDGLPPRGVAAVTRLERLREAGGAFVFIPTYSMWWLDVYPELARHLGRFPRLVDDALAGRLYDVRSPATSSVDSGTNVDEAARNDADAAASRRTLTH